MSFLSYAIFLIMENTRQDRFSKQIVFVSVLQLKFCGSKMD